MSNELLDLIRRTPPQFDEAYEADTECPVCGSRAVARGEISVDDAVDYDDDFQPDLHSWVKISAYEVYCQWFGLQLDSPAELEAAGLEDEWELPDRYPSDYTWSVDEDHPFRKLLHDRPV
jgi:hypothetical protein